MKRTCNLLMIVGLMFGLSNVSLLATPNLNNEAIEQEIGINFVDPSEQPELNTILDEAEMEEFLRDLDAMPQEGLSLQQKASLAWAMIKMQADDATEFVAEHPYGCLAVVAGTAATIAGIIYAIKHAHKQ